MRRPIPPVAILSNMQMVRIVIHMLLAPNIFVIIVVMIDVGAVAMIIPALLNVVPVIIRAIIMISAAQYVVLCAICLLLLSSFL